MSKKTVNIDINKRIKDIYTLLFNSNASQMAKATSVSRTTILSIIGEQQSAPGYDILRRIVEMPSYDINPVWLLTGQGDMLLSENINTAKLIDSSDLVPELPLNAAAGFTDDIQSGVMPSMCNMLPRIPGVPSYDLTISVRGDSMSPTFESGDRIAIRRCFDFFEWGSPHVLDTSEGIYLKRIREAHDSVICISDNPEYPQFNIPKTCIRGIYKVIALLRIC